jgi:hypothetical protein
MDAEHIELGTSAEFWNMIEARRRQRAIGKDDLGESDRAFLPARMRAARTYASCMLPHDSPVI